MDDLTRSRAKTFIDQSIQKTAQESQETSVTFQKLSTIFSQYSEVVKDLLTAKSKYIDVVEKYLGDTPSTGLGDYFPGLRQKGTLGSISSNDMEIDSNDMNDMANLVKDLDVQKENLEDQLERTFKKAVANIHQIESLSTQASNYLDSMITEVGEVYGNSTMQQLVQRNSV